MEPNGIIAHNDDLLGRVYEGQSAWLNLANIKPVTAAVGGTSTTATTTTMTTSASSSTPSVTTSRGLKRRLLEDAFAIEAPPITPPPTETPIIRRPKTTRRVGVAPGRTGVAPGSLHRLPPSVDVSVRPNSSIQMPAASTKKVVQAPKKPVVQVPGAPKKPACRVAPRSSVDATSGASPDLPRASSSLPDPDNDSTLSANLFIATPPSYNDNNNDGRTANASMNATRGSVARMPDVESPEFRGAPFPNESDERLMCDSSENDEEEEVEEEEEEEDEMEEEVEEDDDDDRNPPTSHLGNLMLQESENEGPDVEMVIPSSQEAPPQSRRPSRSETRQAPPPQSRRQSRSETRQAPVTSRHDSPSEFFDHEF